jgi:hypothetical protein
MHRRAQAWGLWLAPAIVVAIAAAALAHALQQRSARSPLTSPALHLPIDELRGHAQEGRVLVHLAREGELTATFVRQHARQLAQRVQSAHDELPQAEDLLKQAAEAKVHADEARARATPRPGEGAGPGPTAKAGVVARLLAALRPWGSRTNGQASSAAAAASAAALAASAAGTESAQAMAAANEARRARRAADNLGRALQRLAEAPQPWNELDVVEPVLAAGARELGFLASATETPR